MIRQSFSSWIQRAWDAPPDPPPRGSWFLSALSHLYRFGARLNRPQVRQAPLPVISVGSIWAGGVGKTPLASQLACLADQKRLRPAIVMRGYRGTVKRGAERVPVRPDVEAVRRFGDEACLHALRQTAPVYVGRRRIEGVIAAKQDGCGLVILDDGMQHRMLARDVEIVSLPARRPFGNERLLPRGPLRELPAALRRASLLILAFADESSKSRETLDRLSVYSPGTPILSWRGIVRLRTFDSDEPAETLVPVGSRVGLFCGIGNPDSFRSSIEQAGYSVAWVASFPDHHFFKDEEIEEVVKRAERDRLAAVVTTAKDSVRIVPRDGLSRTPLLIADLSIEWLEPNAEEVLHAIMEDLR